MQTSSPESLEPNGYRLRMVFNKWWLILCRDGKPTEKALGPFSYHEAVEKAPILNLPDEDRK